MPDEAGAAHMDLCRRAPGPPLRAAVGAGRGAFRAKEFLATPEAAGKLGSHNAAPHGYVEAGGRRGAALTSLDLASKASALASAALYIMAGMPLAAARDGPPQPPPPPPPPSRPAALTAGIPSAPFGGPPAARPVRRRRREEPPPCREVRAVGRLLR